MAFDLGHQRPQASKKSGGVKAGVRDRGTPQGPLLPGGTKFRRCHRGWCRKEGIRVDPVITLQVCGLSFSPEGLQTLTFKR